MLSFFTLDVLDEIWDLTESVSEGLLSTYSIGLAVDTNIQDILIMGDFNLDILKQLPGRKMNNICQYFGLDQLISEYTHFPEISSSVIDLILTSNQK